MSLGHIRLSGSGVWLACERDGVQEAVSAWAGVRPVYMGQQRQAEGSDADLVGLIASSTQPKFAPNPARSAP